MRSKVKKSVAALIMAVLCFGAPVSASAASPELSEEMKQEYYAEYVKIAEEVAKEAELDIEVLPINEFSEEDWRTPQEFRDIITDIANWKIECREMDEVQPYSTTSATKKATLDADGHKYSLSVSGSFDTALNTTTGRQHFQKVNSISSKLSGSSGTWVQTGYESESMDAARTVGITVSGELTVAGAKFKNKIAYVEFYCSATGVVS